MRTSLVDAVQNNFIPLLNDSENSNINTCVKQLMVKALIKWHKKVKRKFPFLIIQSVYLYRLSHLYSI